jgi:hypothetical protein
MSRRAREPEEFGSDSFLDVLANIVGILIILIVSAAARVERGPVAPPPAASVDDPAEPSSEPAKSLPLAMEPDPAVEIAHAEPQAVPEPAPEPDPDVAPPEIAAELQAIQNKLSSLDAKSRALAGHLDRLRTETTAATRLLSAEEQAAAKRAARLQQGKVRLARLEEALGDQKETLTGLVAEFEEVQSSRPPAIEVKHRLAPISQEVTGEELHFRVSGGRVAQVPLAFLVERVKLQMNRQGDWLAGRGRHEAVVGPIDGFTMHYQIERRALSALDRNRLGYGAYRVGISHWEILPEPDLRGETPEEALRRGSKFALAVRTSPDHATLTFWIYPDSFHAYRVLQAACQAEGFVVAARPLPEGMNIAGSPDGTRSAGQ